MTWVRLTLSLLAFTLLTSCDYDHGRTMKRIIWTGTDIHQSSKDLSFVSIVFVDTLGEEISSYIENLSSTEKEFLKNDAVFDSLIAGANEWNNSFGAGNERNLPSSYTHFASAIVAIEDFLKLHEQKPFEDISYVYYMYGATLESARECYLTYESFKYHLPFVTDANKRIIDQKILSVQNIIKNSGNEIAQYLQKSE